MVCHMAFQRCFGWNFSCVCPCNAALFWCCKMLSLLVMLASVCQETSFQHDRETMLKIHLYASSETA